MTLDSGTIASLDPNTISYPVIIDLLCKSKSRFSFYFSKKIIFLLKKVRFALRIRKADAFAHNSRVGTIAL